MNEQQREELWALVVIAAFAAVLCGAWVIGREAGIQKARERSGASMSKGWGDFHLGDPAREAR